MTPVFEFVGEGLVPSLSAKAFCVCLSRATTRVAPTLVLVVTEVCA